MSALSRSTLDHLAAWEITRRQWIEWCHGPGETTWHGDRCGCSDDRCIGFHHDEDDECSCLPAMIDERGESRQAAREAEAAWALPLDDSNLALAAWVGTHEPDTTGHRIVRDHDGTRAPGIWVTNRWNELEHLVWRPGMERLVRWQSDLLVAEIPDVS